MQGIWEDFFRFFDESVFERNRVVKKLLLYRKKGARQNKFISNLFVVSPPHSWLGYLWSLTSSKDTNQPLRLAVIPIILRCCSLFSSYLAFPRNSVLIYYSHIFRRNAHGILKDCHPWWLDGPVSWGWSRNRVVKKLLLYRKKGARQNKFISNLFVVSPPHSWLGYLWSLTSEQRYQSTTASSSYSYYSQMAVVFFLPIIYF